MYSFGITSCVCVYPSLASGDFMVDVPIARQTERMETGSDRSTARARPGETRHESAECMCVGWR